MTDQPIPLQLPEMCEFHSVSVETGANYDPGYHGQVIWSVECVDGVYMIIYVPKEQYDEMD